MNKKVIGVILIVLLIGITVYMFISTNNKLNDENNDDIVDKNPNENIDDNNNDNDDNNNDDDDNNNDNDDDDNNDNNDDDNIDDNDNNSDGNNDDNQDDNNNNNNNNNNDNNNNDNNNNDNNDNQDTDNDNNVTPDPVKTIYNNIEELLNAKNLTAGLTVTTKSFYSNDGGAIYEIVKSTQNKVDNITTFELDNGLYAIYSNKNTNPTSDQFGAVGDGKKDDTAAIQRLLNYNDDVIITKDNYKITETLTINNIDNKTITASGSTFTTSNTQLEITNSNNINIIGLEFQNENVDLTKINNSELDTFKYIISNSDNITISDAKITINSNQTLFSIDNSNNITIKDSEINYLFDEKSTQNISIFKGNLNIDNSNITVKSNNTTTMTNIFDQINSLTNSEIITNIQTNNLFNEVTNISNNNITINNLTSNIFNNTKSTINNNAINIKNMISNIIKYNNTELNNDLSIAYNNILNSYDEISNNHNSKFINITNTNINNKNVNINDNDVLGDKINQINYLLLYEAQGTEEQNISLMNNNIKGYKQRYIINSNIDNLSVKPKIDKEIATVEQMVNDNTLENNQIIKTTGYYNTTGSSYYRIVQSTDIIPTNSEVINLNNGLMAIMFNTGNGVSVDQFGAVGDGTTGDTQAILNAFASGYDYVYLENAKYYLDQPLRIENISNVDFDGKNKEIYYNDQINENNTDEFAILIRRSNDINFINHYINTYSDNSPTVKTQLGVAYADNVEIRDSKFNVEGTRTYNNLDLWTEWKNVIIDNNELIINTSSKEGGNIWIRDIIKTGSSNATFTNNYNYKKTHDESLAVFLGDIENVYVAYNEFIAIDPEGDPSVMNFTLGSDSNTNLKGVVFEHNIIDVESSGGVIWASQGTDTIVRNNEITYKKTPDGITDYIIRGDVYLLEGNTITINEPDTVDSNSTYIVTGVDIVRNNTITTNTKTTGVIEADIIENNNITLNSSSHNILSNGYSVKNNIITTNYSIGSLFNYFAKDVKEPILIENNELNYNYDLAPNSHSTLLLSLNNTILNDNTVTMQYNDINAISVNSKCRLLFLTATDSTPQTINILNNDIDLFKNNYELPSNFHNVTITP